MTVDMSQFYQTFFEESFEGLDNMESGLLNLQVGEPDAETVNTIFRAAHSIKGGAGTFGFKEISDFTHVMETLLDQVRSGERMVSHELMDLLLKSIDCLRDMLNATQDGEEINMDSVLVVQRELEVMLHGKDNVAESPSQQSDDSCADEDRIDGWKIYFKPYEHLMRTGNDPVRIFRELAILGDFSAEIVDDDVPAFTELEPEVCYLAWDITVLGSIPREQVDEIFEWVEDDCELVIEAIAGEAAAADQSQKEPETTVNIAESTQVPAEESTPESKIESAPVASKTTTPAKPAGEKKKLSSAGGEGGSIRVSTDKIDTLINMVGELVITQSMLGQWSEQDGENVNGASIEKLRDGLAQLERNTRELQESVMRIRMLPISFAFQRFPRMVRDLAQKLEKDIELKLSGEQTELDKTVMEKIGDPLVHLVRNSLDHGIEKPDMREAAGKPRTGTVHLNAYHQGGNIVIEISDDGAGLNKEKIVAKARERGIIGSDEVLTDERAYELIFDPGFSTADTVSDVSGRGVGMDVVKRNIRELGGSIEVTSQEGVGSTFTVRLPLTLAILDGQLVRVGNDTYIIPLVSIIESLQIKDEKVNAIAGKAELYKLRNDYIPIVRLHEVFNLKPDNERLSEGLLVVVEGDGQHAGLFVDDLLGQQQVVIKSLETNFRRVDGVSGATILGDGTVALILDAADLIAVSRDPRYAKRRKNNNGQENINDDKQAVA